MKIDYIKTKGFRKFKGDFETKLYDTTVITGKNRSGKSNILYAIVNILLGTNLSGDDKVCIINNKSDLSYGELHFTDNNGMQHIVVRSKHKYNNSMNFITLDGKLVNQNELLNFYRDKKLFLSIINPMYFLLKKSAEQKELIDKYLNDIKPKDIFDKLNDKEQNVLLERYFKGSIEEFKALSLKEKEEFVNLNMANIFLDIAFNRLNKEEQKLLEGIPRNVPTYIAEINENIRKFQSMISTINGKIEYAQKSVDADIPMLQTFEKQTELDLAKQELAFLNADKVSIDKEKQEKVINELEKNKLELEDEINKLEVKMQSGKNEYLKIKNGENSICPTCKQCIDNDSKKTTIENMRASLTADYDRKNILDAKLVDLSMKISIEKAKFYAINGSASVDNSKRIKVIEENIRTLENEQKEIERFNNNIELRKQNNENAKLDISKFKKEKDSYDKNIEQLKKVKEIAQKLYIVSLEEKMKLVTQYFKNVKIRFYSVLKTTGEIKEDFVITYNDKELADLSRSETIATSLEFANMFNKISNANFPIFVDDYESCADYDFIKEYSNNSQLIVSKVEKGMHLKIADYDNNKEYTIIKHNITGYKKMKLNKKSKVQNVPNAA